METNTCELQNEYLNNNRLSHYDFDYDESTNETSYHQKYYKKDDESKWTRLCMIILYGIHF
jgi:hypothetical protein